MHSILKVLCLASVALAAPQRFEIYKNDAGYDVIPIVSQAFNGPFGPTYDFNFEGADNTYREESGQGLDGSDGPSVSRGSWRFVYPDGTPGEFDFVADLNGFQVNSNQLPVGPAIPAHAQEQIERSERERSQGIFHDGQWDPVRYGVRK